jgi:hypothetical protein
VVTVVVDTVFVNSRAVRVRVIVDVHHAVTWEGVVVTVFVEIEDGIVIVDGSAVVDTTFVTVDVMVVDGVTV